MSWLRQAPWLILARVVLTLSQFSLLILLTRLGGVRDGRDFVLGLAICSPLFMLADLGIRNLYLTMRPRPALSCFLAVRLVSVCLVSVTVVPICMLASIPASIAIIVAVLKATDLVSDVYYAGFQAASRSHLIFVLTSVNAGITVGGVWLLLAGTGVSTVALSAAVFGSLTAMIGAIWVDRRTRADIDGQPKFSMLAVLDILRSGSVLGLAMGLASVSVFLPQYFLGAYGPALAVVVFGSLAYAVTATQILIQGVSQAMLVPMRQHIESDAARKAERLAVKVMGVSTLCLIPLGLLGVVFGPMLLEFLFGYQQSGSAAPFAILLLTLCSVPALLCGSSLLLALNRYRSLLWSNLMAGLGVLVVAILLVPAFGLSGALAAASVGIGSRALVVWALAHSAVVRSGRASPGQAPVLGLSQS